ncbi:solute carrier family 46 member 3 [Cynoglossus semilaevis]|uniref:Solute carrier family 46 member 3 n=1 Tax=Cynoglossus semilaevis TaxID=244447 RepID=A0A3P8WVT3_CYNSE|nr:solute carrier family 46 member 3 [Cynoglossus semilaevis]
MKRLYFVEPVVALYAFSSFLSYPLVQQFVYRRLWEQLTNTPYPVSQDSSSCAGNNSSNHSSFHEEVQRDASLFSLYTQLFTVIPSLIVTFLLVTYSDWGGRKMTIIMPLIGMLLYTLFFLAISFYELNIYLLIATSFLSSLFGGPATFLGGCFAYVADLCKDSRQNMVRMARLDMMIGLLTGVAAVSTGYFLKAAGFNWPLLTSALFQCLNLSYAIFVLKETVTKAPHGAVLVGESSPRRSGLKRMIFGVYEMFKNTRGKSRVVLILLILIFTSYNMAYAGGMSLMTLFELNEPLCWTEILIGYGSALSTTVFLVSFGGVFLFTYCRMPPLYIVLIGILSAVISMVLIAFTKTTLMMFLVHVPLFLSIMPFPVLRAMMSKIIPGTEQGALFASLSCLDSLTFSVSSTIFNSVYAATVGWFSGFSFLLSAGLCAIPLFILGVVGVIGVDVLKEEGQPVASLEDENENSPVPN